jgi:hypothetical protein
MTKGQEQTRFQSGQPHLGFRVFDFNIYREIIEK